MRRILLTALTFLLGSSCGDVEACAALLSDPSVVDGVVIVFFNESVRTEAEATRMVEDAWLRIHWFVDKPPPLSAFVSVPNGDECGARERLSANPAIETGNLTVISAQ